MAERLDRVSFIYGQYHRNMVSFKNHRAPPEILLRHRNAFYTALLYNISFSLFLSLYLFRSPFHRLGHPSTALLHARWTFRILFLARGRRERQTGESHSPLIKLHAFVPPLWIRKRPGAYIPIEISSLKAIPFRIAFAARTDAKWKRDMGMP